MTRAAMAMRALLWASGLALGVLLLLSLFRQPLTIPQAAALAIFAGLASIRPLDALLLFAGLAPLLGAIGALFRFSFGGARLLEALALLLLVPWIARQAPAIRHAAWRTVDWALLAFAILVVTSAATHLPAIALRAGTDSVARALWTFFANVYLEHPPGHDVVFHAALLLEGIGLCALVSRHAADPAAVRRIAAMVVAGAAGAALMNIYRLFEIGVRAGSVMETVRATFTSVRINTQFADLNAAGSYFAMTFVAAAGLTHLKSRRGAAFGVAALALGVAVWLSGSRASTAAAALGIIGTLVVCHDERVSFVTRSRKRMLALTALIVALIATLTLLSRTRHNTMRYSVFARVELAETAFRMVGDRPLLGVGVSRFYDLFPQYASPELRQAFFEAALIPIQHENAHNNLLQILAELGIAGFAAFVLVLWCALRPDRLSVDPTGVRAAFALSILVFLLTTLFGHPLLTREVAYPFWMALGLAAAGAPDLHVRWARTLRLVIAGTIVVLVGTVPSRAGYERRHASLEGIALGMSKWTKDESGTRFRWAGPESALFLESWARVVRLPLRAAGSASCPVEIRIDGRPADRVMAPSGFWQEVRLRLPPAAETVRSYRVDFIADPACQPAQADEGRTLMVGRPHDVVVPSGTALPR